MSPFFWSSIALALSLSFAITNSFTSSSSPSYKSLVIRLRKLSFSPLDSSSVRRSGPVRFFASKMGNRQPQPVAWHPEIKKPGPKPVATD